MTDDIQSAARLAKVVEISRGIHHGIALGDAADHLTSTAPVLPGGVATQLTLATTEGLVRTLERAGRQLDHDWAHENLEALRRWATAQGIPGVAPSRDASRSLLTTLPAYAVRRGNAPATVRVLRHGPAALTAAGHRSLGAHALVRTLPFAVLVALHGPGFVWPVPELAGATHGHPLVGPVAVVGALLAARGADRSVPLDAGWLDVLDAHVPEGGELLKTRVGTAIMAAATDPQDPGQLAELAPDRSALSVLAAAVYVVLSHPEPDQLLLAMALASFSSDKQSTSAVVGALVGARHGSTPMLQLGAARLELAWACDALATDLALTSMLTPLGKEPDGQAWLPSWPARYAV
ncbi:MULTISPECIES: ADP-ribosylglycohydrolase family protein [unclassified Ornithinimicrobium]|uniref:ADP-ribosylglycohydrolase family protein n=1 Tax=unclassified Ornithinimicrobium TaxID=2615080 RepID=UPI003851C124